MKKEWKDLLIKSLDEELTQAEKAELEVALRKSSELQQEKADLLKMRNLFANFAVKKEDDFVNKVMERVENEKIVAQRKIGHFLSTIYPKAVAACLLILMSFSLYIYLSEGSFDTESLVGMADLSPDEAYSFLADE